MGLFKSIKKGFKSLWKGVKKVFKKVGKAIGKVLNSKWGKILMVAAAVFTGGMAIAAGFQAFSASTATTFFGKFAAGAKGFLTGLMKPMDQAKKMFGGAAKAAEGVAQVGTAAGQTGGELAAVTDVSGAAVQEGAQVMGGATDVAAGVSEAAAGGVGEAAVGAAQMGAEAEAAAGGVGFSLEKGLTKPGLLQRAGQGIQSVGETVGAGIESVAPKGGWLRNAASAGYDFMNSPVGGYLLSGYGKGMELQEEQDFQDRYRQAWRDPNNPFATRERTQLPTGAQRPAPTGDQTIQYDRFYQQQPEGA